MVQIFGAAVWINRDSQPTMAKRVWRIKQPDMPEIVQPRLHVAMQPALTGPTDYVAFCAGVKRFRMAAPCNATARQLRD